MENKPTLTALSPEKLVALLTRFGFPEMSTEILQQDINNGAPCNEDGTVNLIHYMAWMIKEINGNGNESDSTQTD